MKIKEVTGMGEIIIEFSDEMIVPSNYEEFNEEVLKISLSNNEYPDQSKLLSGWKITSFTTT